MVRCNSYYVWSKSNQQLTTLPPYVSPEVDINFKNTKFFRDSGWTPLLNSGSRT